MSITSPTKKGSPNKKIYASVDGHNHDKFNIEHIIKKS